MTDRWQPPPVDDPTPSQAQLLRRLAEEVSAGRRVPPSEHALKRMLASARRDDGRPSREQIVAALVLADRVGLDDRTDRLDFSELILGRDVESWNSFTAGEIRRVFDAMNGFAAIAHLHIERGRRWRYGRCTSSACPMARQPETSLAHRP